MARGFETEYLSSLGVKTVPDYACESEKDTAERTREIRSIEKRYWQVVTTGSPEIVVEYGNDVDSNAAGSGYYCSCSICQHTTLLLC